MAWSLSVLEDEKVRGKGGGTPKGIWVRRATWEESLGSQSVPKPVSETGPLLDKRGMKEKVKKRASLI